MGQVSTLQLDSMLQRRMHVKTQIFNNFRVITVNYPAWREQALRWVQSRIRVGYCDGQGLEDQYASSDHWVEGGRCLREHDRGGSDPSSADEPNIWNVRTLSYFMAYAMAVKSDWLAVAAIGCQTVWGPI